MPAYNYKCKNCSNSFEIKATIQQKEEGSNAKFKCPKCNSKEIEREFSLLNFIKSIFMNDSSGDCCFKGNCCESKSEKKQSCCGSNGENNDCYCKK